MWRSKVPTNPRYCVDKKVDLVLLLTSSCGLQLSCNATLHFEQNTAHPALKLIFRRVEVDNTELRTDVCLQVFNLLNLPLAE